MAVVLAEAGFLAEFADFVVGFFAAGCFDWVILEAVGFFFSGFVWARPAGTNEPIKHKIANCLKNCFTRCSYPKKVNRLASNNITLLHLRFLRSYPQKRMNDLDQMWSQMLDEAMQAARLSGRHDVADYLDLKARNDAIRQASVRWLFESVIEIAAGANRKFSAISIDRDDPHNFAHRGSNMAGSRLILRQGIRCLTVEAGWTRTPADGFMRGGALAVAKITHFGMAKMNVELILKPADGKPGWLAVYEDGASIGVDSDFLRQHFALFLGE
jgi:hypothetical protein